MNRIYKTVWSKTRSSWVVVSEIARNAGGKVGRGGLSRTLTAAVLMSLMAGTVAVAADAAAADSTADPASVVTDTQQDKAKSVKSKKAASAALTEEELLRLAALRASVSSVSARQEDAVRGGGQCPR